MNWEGLKRVYRIEACYDSYDPCDRQLLRVTVSPQTRRGLQTPAYYLKVGFNPLLTADEKICSGFIIKCLFHLDAELV